MSKVRKLLAVLLMLLGSGSLRSHATEEHVDAQINAVGQILNLMQGSQDAQARGIVEAARAKSAATPRDDVLRADALELQRTYLRAKDQYKEALPLSRDILVLRRRAHPVEDALLGFDLYEHAVITYANNLAAEADTAFRDALDAFRRAFKPDDVRLAQRLKAAADLAATPGAYNRPRFAIDLLTEAVAVRERATNSSGEALADTLEQLAMLEMRFTSPDAADRHLEQAARLLERAAAQEKSASRRDVLNGGRADMAIMRAGIAAKRGMLSDADRLIRQAQTILPNSNADDVIGQHITIAEIRAQILERSGDLDGAIRASDDQLGLALSMKHGDPLLIADIAEQIGILRLSAGDLDEAEQAFATALKGKGGEANAGTAILLRQAEIKARRGQAKEAEALYRRGLAQRKNETSEVPVLFATNRARQPGSVPSFGGELAPELTFGEALVLVPGGPGSKDAVMGPAPAGAAELGAATAADHLIVLPPRVMTAAEFAAVVRQRAERAAAWSGTAIVFVHGFGTRFTSAIARVGQITRDLGYDGPAFVFSWPSQGVVVSRDAYYIDQDRSIKSAGSLAAFIATVAQTTGAAKVHIVAHSMGNRVLLPAITELKSNSALAARIGEVVFASPDVDQREFAQSIAALKGFQLTLYASANDKAMWASWFANIFSTRAGYVAKGLLASGLPLILPGIDSIDVSDAGADLLSFNHDVYASNSIVTDDLRRLLQQGTRPPDARSHAILERRVAPGGTYWAYRRG